VGHLIHPLLPHFGVANPIMAWVLAPVIGFILASIPLRVAGQYVHNRVEHHYKYSAGELRLALWERLNTRIGICLGLLNGAVYFVLISFFVFNFAYWTTQSVKDPSNSSDEPLPIRLVNSMGDGLQSSGFAKTASAVATLPPLFYQLADFSGLLMQNPQLASRLADYPGFTSLWHRDDLQSLVSDPSLTNALAAGTSLGEIVKLPSVQGLIANRDLTQSLEDTLVTNLPDIKTYLDTGKSPKFGGEKLTGNWEFNASVTLAWLRQEEPKMNVNEMRALRALWAEAYGPTTIEVTGDNQVFVKDFPKFVAAPQPKQPAFQGEDWKGDWSRSGTNYTIHLTLNNQDKYLSGTTDGLRLRLKDGHNLLIFDHVD
jgi:hypothetical protein